MVIKKTSEKETRSGRASGEIRTGHGSAHITSVRAATDASNTGDEEKGLLKDQPTSKALSDADMPKKKSKLLLILERAVLIARVFLYARALHKYIITPVRTANKADDL